VEANDFFDLQRRSKVLRLCFEATHTDAQYLLSSAVQLGLEVKSFENVSCKEGNEPSDRILIDCSFLPQLAITASHQYKQTLKVSQHFFGWCEFASTPLGSDFTLHPIFSEFGKGLGWGSTVSFKDNEQRKSLIPCFAGSSAFRALAIHSRRSHFRLFRSLLRYAFA